MVVVSMLIFGNFNSNNFLESWFLVSLNRQRNLSDDWLFSESRSGDWDFFGHRNSLENWILNMVNIILHVIFLN